MVEKRPLGKTNLMVSRLCYGTLALGPYHSNKSVDEGGQLLVKAYENGINFWDTAELYETNGHIKEALRLLDYPEDLVIASRTYSRSHQEMLESIDNTLNELGLKTIPIFGIHELDGKQDYEVSKPAFQALKEAKEKGLIQHIAVTMHSIESVSLVTELEEVDVIFPLYNKQGIGIKDGTAAQMTEAIKKAALAGKGVYAMKVLGGGHLVQKAEECFDFALNNDDIASIAVGMDNEAELMMNMSYFAGDKQASSSYKKDIGIQRRKISIDPWCEGCEACMKACPNNAISMEFGQAKVDFQKCVLCGYCATQCKYFCIKVVKAP